MLNFKNVDVKEVIKNWDEYKNKNNSMNDFIRNVVEDLVFNNVVYKIHNKLNNTDTIVTFNKSCNFFIINDKKVCLKYAINNILITSLVIENFKHEVEIYNKNDYINVKANKILNRICTF